MVQARSINRVYESTTCELSPPSHPPAETKIGDKFKVLDLDRDGVVSGLRWAAGGRLGRGGAGHSVAAGLTGLVALAPCGQGQPCLICCTAPDHTLPAPLSVDVEPGAGGRHRLLLPHRQSCVPTHPPTRPPHPPAEQISTQELADAMGFLREQMGEEELRHLLEMLSVEAGALAHTRRCVWVGMSGWVGGWEVVGGGAGDGATAREQGRGILRWLLLHPCTVGKCCPH